MYPSKGMSDYMAEINRLFPNNDYDIQDTSIGVASNTSSIFNSTSNYSSPTRSSITDSLPNLSPIRSDTPVDRPRFPEFYDYPGSTPKSRFSSLSSNPKNDLKVSTPNRNEGRLYQNSSQSSYFSNSSIDQGSPVQNICEKLFPKSEPSVSRNLYMSDTFKTNSTPNSSNSQTESIFSNLRQSYVTVTPTQQICYTPTAVNVPQNVTFSANGDNMPPGTVMFMPTVSYVPTVNLTQTVNLPMPVTFPSNILSSPNCDGNTSQMLNNFKDELKSSKMCSFCRKNGETPVVYLTHVVKKRINGQQIVTCPILRSLVCTVCGVSGDFAHTITYCPLMRNTNNGAQPASTTISLKNTRVKSNGKRRY